MGVLIILVLVALVIYIGFLQVQARKDLHVVTSLGKIAIQETIDRTFGSTWHRTNGPGMVNVRPKLRSGAPTISVDAETSGGGGTAVHIWMSHWSTRMGMVNHAQLVWRKERQLAQRLEQAGSVTGGVAPLRPAGTSGRTRPSTADSITRPSAGTKTRQSNTAPSRSNRTSAVPASGANAEMLQVMEQGHTNLVVRSTRSTAELSRALRTAVSGTQEGSDSHLLLGPPRATMWAYFEHLTSDETLLVLSLVTHDNPDLKFIAENVQAPLAKVVAQLGATLEAIDGTSLPSGLRKEILGGRVVPLREVLT